MEHLIKTLENDTTSTPHVTCTTLNKILHHPDIQGIDMGVLRKVLCTSPLHLNVYWMALRVILRICMTLHPFCFSTTMLKSLCDTMLDHLHDMALVNLNLRILGRAVELNTCDFETISGAIHKVLAHINELDDVVTDETLATASAVMVTCHVVHVPLLVKFLSRGIGPLTLVIAAKALLGDGLSTVDAVDEFIQHGGLVLLRDVDSKTFFEWTRAISKHGHRDKLYTEKLDEKFVDLLREFDHYALDEFACQDCIWTMTPQTATSVLGHLKRRLKEFTKHSAYNASLPIYRNVWTLTQTIVRLKKLVN